VHGDSLIGVSTATSESWLRGAYYIPEKHLLLQAEQLLDGRQTAEATPRELFASVDDDFWAWALSTGRRRSEALSELLPGLPEEELQRQSVGGAGDEALRAGAVIYRTFRRIYEAYRGELASAEAILDFGCGWGRVLRFFLKDVEPDRLWGVDQYKRMIEVCRETIHWGNFSLIKPAPPIEFADSTFDLIFCFSVFSHLSEDVHRQWIDEFARILKPGGLLVATTWDRELIERCRDLRKEPPGSYPGLRRVFLDTDAWLARYDRGEFCFDTSAETYKGTAWFQGETCIPKKYVLEHWSQKLDVLDYLEDRAILNQNIVVAQR
jgi:SAM-dependent methyltransferase